MSAKEIEVYRQRVEEVKNKRVDFYEKMRRELLIQEERYAKPERKLEI